MIDPKKGLKSIARTGKGKGYQFDKAELNDALNEMNQGGAFNAINLDALVPLGWWGY